MKKALKWAAIAILAVQWYARGGREFLFGEQPFEFGVGEVMRVWVALPDGMQPPLSSLPSPLLDPAGEEVGVITKARAQRGALDRAGYPVERHEVYVEAVRGAFGWPINVAVAQANEWTLQSLGIG